MKSVLIACRDQTTCKAMFNKLTGDFKLSLLKSAQDLSTNSNDHQLIVLDSDYTSKHAIDLLSRLRSTTDSPILYLVNSESANCAIKAIEQGANNYVVKTSHYLDLLPSSIRLAIDQYEEVERLRQENRKLIAHLKSTEQMKKQEQPGEPAEEAAEAKTLIDKINDRLKQGDVDLPSVPDLILKINELVESGASVSALAKLIGNDTAITTGLIRISNTPRYRGVQENRSLEQSINRLGIAQSMVFVQMISNRSLFATKDKLLAPLFKQLWHHSMACAHTSQIVSEKLARGDRYEIFMMALLHDVGSLFLMQVVAEIRAGGDDTELTTDQIFELLSEYHESFGRSLLQRWHFPTRYIDVASHHEHPEKCSQASDELLIVNFSNRLVNSMGYGFRSDEKAPMVTAKWDRTLGLNDDVLEKIIEETSETLEEVNDKVN